MEKEIYYKLVYKIIGSQEGVWSEKRHGHYIRLNVFGNWYLSLDTWNKSISVYEGAVNKDNLGIDFGGFKCNLTMVNFWLAHL